MNYRIAFVLAGIDLTIATICAANGDAYFVPFMLLAGIMYIYGIYVKAKADKEIGD